MVEAEESGRPLVLVTGVGRAQGIGAAVVRRLASDGWDIALTYWRAYDERMPWGVDNDGRKQIRDAAETAGSHLVEVASDLASAANIPLLFDAIAEQTGRLPSGLVLCHCESVDSTMLDTSVESFDRHYAVNVRATWLLIREFALRFPPDVAGGRIVAMTSDHTVGNVPYGATKAALDRVVLASARELDYLRVSANVVNPGPTDTGWMSAEVKARIADRTPLGRLGQPADVANLVSFLFSADGGWVNGQLLSSDGGLSALN